MGPIKVSYVRTIDNVHRKYDITGIIIIIIIPPPFFWIVQIC